MHNFIFIDGSYFCFYKYYSTVAWWKKSFPDSLLEDPINNTIFVEKFKKNFIHSIHEISKKLNIIDPIYIVGKDCKRNDIWRNEFYKEYKATRINDVVKVGAGPFFNIAYDENLFIENGINHILYHNRLEADDCIALATKYILNKYPESNINIITSDKDYLQLVEPRVKLFNLSFQNLAELKSSNNNPDYDLFCKIVMGDNSDNIKSIFPKCGPITALKYYHNKELFQNKLVYHNAFDAYELNRKLIDFNEIPEELIHSFLIYNSHKLIF
jgi:5'-3' exonuclease